MFLFTRPKALLINFKRSEIPCTVPEVGKYLYIPYTQCHTREVLHGRVRYIKDGPHGIIVLVTPQATCALKTWDIVPAWFSKCGGQCGVLNPYPFATSTDTDALKAIDEWKAQMVAQKAQEEYLFNIACAL